MKARIQYFRTPEGLTTIRGARLIATFTAQMDHFLIYGMKAVMCPRRGLLVWSPSQVRLSMEGREAIHKAVERELERTCGEFPHV